LGTRATWVGLHDTDAPGMPGVFRWCLPRTSDLSLACMR